MRGTSSSSRHSEDFPCSESGSLGTAPGPAGYEIAYAWFDAAIIAVTNTMLNNSFTVTGGTSNDGDIYITDGDLSITNTPSIYGNVYVPNGGVAMSKNNQIIGNLWANEAINIQSPASVTGDVTSSLGALTGTSGIGGDARGGGTIAASLNVGGSEYPSSPHGPRRRTSSLSCATMRSPTSAVPSPGRGTSGRRPRPVRRRRRSSTRSVRRTSSCGSSLAAPIS
jgi:hypothetical protein